MLFFFQDLSICLGILCIHFFMFRFGNLLCLIVCRPNNYKISFHNIIVRKILSTSIVKIFVESSRLDVSYVSASLFLYPMVFVVGEICSLLFCACCVDYIISYVVLSFPRYLLTLS